MVNQIHLIIDNMHLVDIHYFIVGFFFGLFHELRQREVHMYHKQPDRSYPGAVRRGVLAGSDVPRQSD
jgi:hypothetical protein